MDLSRLRSEEKRFFAAFPGGFAGERMAPIVKKHDIGRVRRLVAEELGPEAFDQPLAALESLSRLYSRSTLVSVFEKTAFRNLLASLTAAEQASLARLYGELLHGDRPAAFDRLAAWLKPRKLAKWILLTSPLYYSDPHGELALKPTTAKGVIAAFDLPGLHYTPHAHWAFYRDYREAVLSLKAAAGPSLRSLDNGFFSGFLLFALGEYS